MRTVERKARHAERNRIQAELGDITFRREARAWEGPAVNGLWVNPDHFVGFVPEEGRRYFITVAVSWPDLKLPPVVTEAVIR